VGGTAILRTGSLSAIAIAALISFALSNGTVQAEPVVGSGDSPFKLRIINVDPAQPPTELRENLDFYRSIGFNAFSVASGKAGIWTAELAPERPHLDPQFLALARWCEERSLPLYVTINPHADSRGSFRYSDPGCIRRLLKFCRLLRRKAGIRHFVISFKQAPLRLIELRDIVRYGLSAVPAHLALASRLRNSLRGADHLWLRAAVASDINLDNPDLHYSSALLTGLDSLDPRIGMVWSGPAALSASIGASQIESSRTRLGERPLLLDDRYSFGAEGETISLAVALGPLRNREPAIAQHLDGYRYNPMSDRGGSRLTILTVADFLGDPSGYDPDKSWAAAMERLAGDDSSALTALKTQALEWGGWILERNYRSILSDNPTSAAEGLRDPATVARWGWTARRYRQRMTDLAGLQDPLFRRDLLETMDRRHAVASAIPTVRELRARIAAGRSDTSQLIEQLLQERRDLSSRPGALRALDRFLAAAGLAALI
jgi:hypothetical protein